MTETGFWRSVGTEACGRSVKRSYFSKTGTKFSKMGLISVKRVLNSVKQVLNSVKTVLNLVYFQSNGRVNLRNVYIGSQTALRTRYTGVFYYPRFSYRCPETAVTGGPACRTGGRRVGAGGRYGMARWVPGWVYRVGNTGVQLAHRLC